MGVRDSTRTHTFGFFSRDTRCRVEDRESQPTLGGSRIRSTNRQRSRQSPPPSEKELCEDLLLFLREEGSEASKPAAAAPRVLALSLTGLELDPALHPARPGAWALLGPQLSLTLCLLALLGPPDSLSCVSLSLSMQPSCRRGLEIARELAGHLAWAMLDPGCALACPELLQR